MLKKGKPRKITRRRFIKTTSLVAGAAMLPTMTAEAKTISATIGPALLKPARIGVFLPRTRKDSPEAKNFLTGLQLQLKTGKNTQLVELNSATVRFGFGSLEDKFEKVTQETKPNLIIGLTNPAHSYLHSTTLETGQTAFLGVSLGENVPRFAEGATGYSQNVAHLSFMSSETNWLLGYWAAENVGKRAVLATSFYDSGFDSLWAFQAGFEAGGGAVVGRLITHTAMGNSNLAYLPKIVSETQPDLVFASYHNQAAREFLTTYKETGLASRLPLFGSAFLTAGNNLDSAFGGIKTAASWSPALENTNNTQFVAAYLKQNERRPDVFAMLGYEAALLATDFLNTGTFGPQSGFSPRTELTLNPLGQLGSKTFYLQEVQQVGETYNNSIIQPLAIPAALYSSLRTLQVVPKSGWLNSYTF